MHVCARARNTRSGTKLCARSVSIPLARVELRGRSKAYSILCMHCRRGRVRHARSYEGRDLSCGITCVGDQFWMRVATYGFPGLWQAPRLIFGHRSAIERVTQGGDHVWMRVAERNGVTLYIGRHCMHYMYHCVRKHSLSFIVHSAYCG